MFSAMAKKSGSKGSLGYDYHNLTPEQKQKVNAVCDQFPEIQKDTVAIVLDHHDFDQDKAIDALTSDGGSSAFTSWKNLLESNQMKANKNKKRNKKRGKKEGFQINNNSIAASGNDGDDSSSLHSSSNIDFDPEKESSSKTEDCGDNCEKFEKDCFDSYISDNNEGMNVPVVGDDSSGKILTLTATTTSDEHRLEDRQDCSSVVVQSSDVIAEGEQGSTYYEANEERESSDVKNTDEASLEKNEDHVKILSHKHHNRQRHSSSQHSKSSSISEDIHSNLSVTTKNRGGLVKCTKDLTRQTISLQRIELQLGSKLEEASKCLKNTFTEVRKMLDKRQADMEEELTKVKTEAMNLLRSRQDLASELKRKVDRANSMNESEWNELRADIKQFVTERKYDDELGKTIWFRWSMDAITEAVSSLGEVCPVKNSYSQRQQPPSNKSPELSDDNQSLKGRVGDNTWMKENSAKNNQLPVDSANANSNEILEAKSVKDTIGRTSGQGVRVFSSTRYNHGGRYPNHSRGRGFYKGHGGGGFSRGRHYDSWQYGGGNDRHNDYRKQYHHDRTNYQQQSVIGGSQAHDADAASAHPPPFPRDNRGHYNRGSFDRKPFSTFNKPQRGAHNQYGKSPGVGRMRFSSDTVANSDISLGKVENQEPQQKRQNMYNGC